MQSHYTNLILAILFFSFIPELHAQPKRTRTFCELSRPEKCWVISHPFVANRAWKVTKEVRFVTEAVQNDSLLDGDADGGQVDAFRHCYWMAELSRTMHWRKARRLGEAHEKGNYLSFKKGKTEDGTLPDSAASAMDRFNNHLGLELAKEYKHVSADSMRIIVLNVIKEGKAKIISKDSSGIPLDCEAKIIDMLLYRGQWNNPKCLIPSNGSIR
jgi:hypothetical protein